MPANFCGLDSTVKFTLWHVREDAALLEPWFFRWGCGLLVKSILPNCHAASSLKYQGFFCFTFIALNVIVHGRTVLLLAVPLFSEILPVTKSELAIVAARSLAR